MSPCALLRHSHIATCCRSCIISCFLDSGVTVLFSHLGVIHVSCVWTPNLLQQSHSLKYDKKRGFPVHRKCVSERIYRYDKKGFLIKCCERPLENLHSCTGGPYMLYFFCYESALIYREQTRRLEMTYNSAFLVGPLCKYVNKISPETAFK